MNIRERLANLSLGWRFGWVTALVVILILGTITAFQVWWSIRQDFEMRQTFLMESLDSFAADIEESPDISSIQKIFTLFHRMNAHRHGCFHAVIQQPDGKILAATEPYLELPENNSFCTELKLKLPSSPNANLIAWQDMKKFQAEKRHRWIWWMLDLIIMVVTIIGSLLIANYYLVNRPLNALVNDIRRLELGYKSSEEIVPKGAKEIQWLALHFRRLGLKLEEMMANLVETERRIRKHYCGERLNSDHRFDGSGTCLETGMNRETIACEIAVRKETGQNEQKEELLKLCRSLEQDFLSIPEKKILAQKSWDTDIPTAERIGEHQLKSRLEDAAFQILFPKKYEMLRRKLTNLLTSQLQWTRKCYGEIIDVLNRAEIPVLVVQYRFKNPGSIWRKMQEKSLTFEQVQDIFAFRIIVPREEHCYLALEAIHQHFKPLYLRFKDYIAKPKPNGYQSIHTSVQSESGIVFEVQIRTAAMHQEAEWGNSSHWRYKAQSAKPRDVPRSKSRRHKIKLTTIPATLRPPESQQEF